MSETSHVGTTMMNRPWLQAILDVEAGTPVEAVWMTEAELEADHLERAGNRLPATKPAPVRESIGEPIAGRWCGARIVPRGLMAFGDEDRIRCGGELLYRRRLEGGSIVSYLICQFCGAQTPMLACNTTTGEHTSRMGQS